MILSSQVWKSDILRIKNVRRTIPHNLPFSYSYPSKKIRRQIKSDEWSFLNSKERNNQEAERKRKEERKKGRRKKRFQHLFQSRIPPKYFYPGSRIPPNTLWNFMQMRLLVPSLYAVDDQIWLPWTTAISGGCCIVYTSVEVTMHIFL